VPAPQQRRCIGFGRVFSQGSSGRQRRNRNRDQALCVATTTSAALVTSLACYLASVAFARRRAVVKLGSGMRSTALSPGTTFTVMGQVITCD